MQSGIIAGRLGEGLITGGDGRLPTGHYAIESGKMISGMDCQERAMLMADLVALWGRLPTLGCCQRLP